MRDMAADEGGEDENKLHELIHFIPVCRKPRNDTDAKQECASQRKRGSPHHFRLSCGNICEDSLTTIGTHPTLLLPAHQFLRKPFAKSPVVHRAPQYAQNTNQQQINAAFRLLSSSFWLCGLLARNVRRSNPPALRGFIAQHPSGMQRLLICI